MKTAVTTQLPWMGVSWASVSLSHAAARPLEANQAADGFMR